MSILNPFPHFAAFQFTPTIPAIYWNTRSPEQAFCQLAQQNEKIVAFIDSMVDTVNAQYQIVSNLQSQLPQLVESDVNAYLDANLADNTSTLYTLVNTVITDWADAKTAQVDALQNFCDSITVGSTYEDLHDHGFLYIPII